MTPEQSALSDAIIAAIAALRTEADRIDECWTEAPDLKRAAYFRKCADDLSAALLPKRRPDPVDLDDPGDYINADAEPM